MAIDRNGQDDFVRPIRRILIGVLIFVLLALFALWRIDSPRVERFRAALVDRVVPSFDWALVPVTKLADMADSFESYARIYEQNQELRRELAADEGVEGSRAAAGAEERQAARPQPGPARPQADQGHRAWCWPIPGRPSASRCCLNVGARDGIVDGWAVMDGLGLVGRISGVGQTTSRVILLTDSNSRIPVTIQPSGQRALVAGDNTAVPPLEFLENPDLVRPGDRVVSSGDGGVFPAGLLVGQVVQGADQRLRVRLSADYERLDFLRVLRSHATERIDDPGSLIAPQGGAAARPRHGGGRRRQWLSRSTASAGATARSSSPSPRR